MLCSITVCFHFLVALIHVNTNVHNIAAFSTTCTYTSSIHKRLPTAVTHLAGSRKNKSSSIDPVVGYVPDGLTPEQYAKIKKEELDKKKKLNYGAWGPRFARSERPDGDWMIVPSLWTGGFDSNAKFSFGVASSNNNGGEPRKKNHVNRFVHGVQKYSPLYLFSLSIVEVAATNIHTINAKMSISLFSLLYRQIKTQAINNLVKADLILLIRVSIIKMMIAGLMIKPLGMLIEKCNSKLLWSPRRTVTYISLAAMIPLIMSLIIKSFIL